jgi:hypothetical protein
MFAVLESAFTDLVPFQRWQLRYKDEDLSEDLTNRLFELILRQDILPGIPLEVEAAVDDRLASEVLNRLLDAKRAVSAALQFPVESLAYYQRTDLPMMATPDSLTMDILNLYVLSSLPLEYTGPRRTKAEFHALEITMNEYALGNDSDSLESLTDGDASPYRMVSRSVRRSVASDCEDTDHAEEEDEEEEEEEEEEAQEGD